MPEEKAKQLVSGTVTAVSGYTTHSIESEDTDAEALEHKAEDILKYEVTAKLEEEGEEREETNTD